MNFVEKVMQNYQKSCLWSN